MTSQKAPALSIDVAAIQDALAILSGPLSEVAGKDSEAFSLLYGAASYLRRHLRALLTTEVGQR